MLEEKITDLEIIAGKGKKTAGSAAIYGLSLILSAGMGVGGQTAVRYLAQGGKMAVVAATAVYAAGCDDDTCETNTDCSEDASCLRECTRCINEDFDSDGHPFCLTEDTSYRSPGEESRSGEQCGAYHCYRPHQTTTYTRED